MTIKQLEKAGSDTVKELRKNKLSMGLPFIINTNDLPSTQFYLEYPDGYIKLVTFRQDKLDYKFIIEFNIEQSNEIRKKYKLYDL